MLVIGVSVWFVVEASNSTSMATSPYTGAASMKLHHVLGRKNYLFMGSIGGGKVPPAYYREPP